MNDLNGRKMLGSNLDRPQCNSSAKLFKKLEEINSLKTEINLDEQIIERICEKASTKLNIRGPIYDGLVSIEPDQEDFLKHLEIKQKQKIRTSISNPKTNNQNAPDLMEFYPSELINEFPEIDIEPAKLVKLNPIKASMSLSNDPIDKYFKWN